MELFRIYENLDSTNKEAARLLTSEGDLHGTAILAYQQTDGRGQYGRSWFADPGNHLALSIIIQPQNMIPAELPLVSMKVSLAIVRTLDTMDIPFQPRIKWPNDIYAGDMKLAGILIENSLSSHNVQHCIMGIGMNVNEADFPDDIKNAVSIYQLTGRKFEVRQLAVNMKNAVMDILEEPLEIWKPEYDRYVYGLGKQMSFDLKGTAILAKIMGIDLEGKIILDTMDGNSKSYFLHEIKWII